MADISFAQSAKIRDCRCEIQKISQNSVLRLEIISNLCGVINRRFIGWKYMVKRADFAHKYLIYTYKITKNQPLDQIFTPLILLKMRYFTSLK